MCIIHHKRHCLTEICDMANTLKTLVIFFYSFIEHFCSFEHLWVDLKSPTFESIRFKINRNSINLLYNLLKQNNDSRNWMLQMMMLMHQTNVHILILQFSGAAVLVENSSKAYILNQFNYWLFFVRFCYRCNAATGNSTQFSMHKKRACIWENS